MKKSPLLLLLIFFSVSNLAAEEFLRLATTTSTENSGLLAVLHPPFEELNDVKIHVIAVGTGKALRLGENGDVDVLMVHAPAAEVEFVEKGFGVERLAVMHNDFVIVGPGIDPADLRSVGSLNQVMERISGSAAGFISRGDDSGTHKMEMSLWDKAGIVPGGAWYMAVGQGMGAVLQIADDKQAYALTDRGTYLAYKDKIDLVIVSAGAQELLNPYHVIMVNPDKHPHIKTDIAKKYIDFLRGERGQDIIREYRISGDQLFFPDVIP